MNKDIDLANYSEKLDFFEYFLKDLDYLYNFTFFGEYKKGEVLNDFLTDIQNNLIRKTNWYHTSTAILYEVYIRERR